jgi:Arm DNA-binding domain
MAVNLTDARIRALKPAEPGKRYDVRDAQPGMLVRVTSSGNKTFMLQARFPGSRHATRRAIGEFGAMSLDAARDIAREWLALIRRGLDPAVELSEQKRLAEHQRQEELKRREQHHAARFGAVAEDYIRGVLQKQRQAKRSERSIRKELIASWGERPITTITRGDVRELIDKITARDQNKSGAYARNIYSHAQALFNWAINRDAYNLETSPA